jgi:predicted DNA-binding transcriptional regulator AlpA
MEATVMPDSIFYTKLEVCAVTRLARASIDRLEAAGQFPRRFNLTEYSAKNPGGKLTGKVVWWKTEVDEWCLARSRRILKPPPSDDSLDDASLPPLHV